MKAKIKLLLYNIYRTAIRKVVPGLLIFESNLGRSYGGNPRAVYEEFLRRGLDKKYTLCWVFTEPEKAKVPGNVKILGREKLSTLMRMQRAAVWVTDTRQPAYVIKNPKTFYMMTWHGTPLKKLGLNLEGASPRYKTQLTTDVSQWDCLLAQSETAAELFRRCFNYQGEILCGGYPRNDVLVLKKEQKKPEERAVRTILYAPTWREYESDGECNSRFEAPLDLDRVAEVLGDRTRLLIKYHYYVKTKPDLSRYDGKICEATEDIADIYPDCDLLITDYSSVMFDYAVLGRPMIFFAYDLERYRASQGFYFEYEEFVPGPLARTEEELLSMLKEDYSFEPYKEKQKKFCERFSGADDGHAAERAADRIKKILR